MLNSELFALFLVSVELNWNFRILKLGQSERTSNSADSLTPSLSKKPWMFRYDIIDPCFDVHISVKYEKVIFRLKEEDLWK